MTTLLALLPVTFGLFGAVWSILNTIIKIRARDDLSIAIRSNSHDLTELKKDLDSRDLEAATALAMKYTRDLSARERREANAALTQASQAGREAYMDGMLSGGAITKESSAVHSS
jgi:hypothetical protein